MKVIVRCPKNRVTKTEMEQIIESLFQENKDLRVQVGHLRDELNLSQQQSEARRQVICERDKLVQELNDQIAADEEELREQTEKLKTKIANVGAERDNFEASYKQVIQWWGNEQTKAREAEARAEEYRIALMESDCRIAELEKQLEWVRDKNDEWAAVAQGLRNTIDEMKAQKEADDKKCEETCTDCNELYEDVLAERNHLRDRVKNYEKSVTFAKMEEAMLTISHLREEVARLTNERDTAVNENTEMMFNINELQDKWEAEHNLRVEANRQIEELTAEVDTCHHNIDGYIEGNRRMRAEYEKKLETEQDQTKHWRKKYDNLKENYDELVQLHREWGEEIDRLRKVVIELQSNRSLTNEIHEMLYKYLTTVNIPSADK